jgi:hypothetical protein
VTSSPAKPHGDLEELAQKATRGEWYHAAELIDPPEYLWASFDDVDFVEAATPARVLSLIGEARELREAAEHIIQFVSDNPVTNGSYVSDVLSRALAGES